MKTVIVLLMMTGLVYAVGNPDMPIYPPGQGNMISDHAPLPPFSNPEPVWNDLLAMSAADRANSLIELELESGAGEAALQTSQSIENLWNNGRYDEALALFDELAKQTDIRKLAIGNSWRVPVPTQEAALWGTDIRIGNRDSLTIVAFDIHRASGHLFAVLGGPSGGRTHWYVNLSTDNGTTWSETYAWLSAAGEPLYSMSAAVADEYCFVAYTALNPQTEARVRRFSAETGAVDFAFGFVTVFQTVDPEYIKEVNISTNQEAFDNRLYLMVITSIGDLRFFWDIATDGTTWIEDSPAVTNANKGLDATFNQGYALRFFFVSYYDVDDNVHVLAHDASTWYAVMQIAAGSTTDYTSISAYDDLVICAYDKFDTDHYWEYRITRDAGESWSSGTLYEDEWSESPDVTAKMGAGLAVTYRYFTSNREQIFAYRGYDPGPWPIREVISEDQPYWNKPAIEYIGGGTYGVVHLSWFSPHNQAAYFDKGVSGCAYVLGDVNNNGAFNGIDVSYSVGYFKGGPPPPFSCDCNGSDWYVAGDVNGNCAFNGIDVSYMVGYFKGGPGPIPCPACPPAGIGALGSPIMHPQTLHDNGISASGE